MASSSTAAERNEKTEMANFSYAEWNLLFQQIKGSVREKADVVVAFAHCMLVNQCNFRCIGVGQCTTLSKNEVGSGTKRLPNKWNGECRCQQYALRYRHGQRVYLLIGQMKDDGLVLNLMDTKNRQVTNITILPDPIVDQIDGRVEDVIPRHSELYDRLKSELIGPIYSVVVRDPKTRTPTPSEPSSSQKKQDDSTPSVLSESSLIMPTPSDKTNQDKEEPKKDEPDSQDPDKQKHKGKKSNKSDPDKEETNKDETNKDETDKDETKDEETNEDGTEKRASHSQKKSKTERPSGENNIAANDKININKRRSRSRKSSSVVLVDPLILTPPFFPGTPDDSPIHTPPPTPARVASKLVVKNPSWASNVSFSEGKEDPIRRVENTSHLRVPDGPDTRQYFNPYVRDGVPLAPPSTVDSEDEFSEDPSQYTKTYRKS